MPVTRAFPFFFREGGEERDGEEPEPIDRTSLDFNVVSVVVDVGTEEEEGAWDVVIDVLVRLVMEIESREASTLLLWWAFFFFLPSRVSATARAGDRRSRTAYSFVYVCGGGS